MEHDKFANDLVTRVAEPLKLVTARYEEIRKRHVDYAVKLEKERDAGYSELKKTKGSYDGVCQDVESRRKKADGNAKAQGVYRQYTENMQNVKNTYLININVTNKQKEKYYHEYVPDMLDSLQDLSETRTKKLNHLWTVAANLEVSRLGKMTDHVRHFADEIPRNDPHLDSRMFIQHNVAPWQEPPDFAFEPSPVWHDDDAMVTDETAKIFLRNLMSKSKAQLGELRREVDKKRKELEGVQRIRESVRAGKDKRDEVEVVTAILALTDELHRIDHKRLTAEVETSTIQSAVGDVTVGAKNHNFKAQTFKIPTNCDLCAERIWGLSAKGFDCRDCGYTCHSKCEMKVPATCPGEQSKEEKKKLKSERQEAARVSQPRSNGGGGSDGSPGMTPPLSRADTMSSLSSGYAASAHRSVSGTMTTISSEETSPLERNTTIKAIPTKSGAIKKNRIVAPPPAQYIKEPLGDDLGSHVESSSLKRGKMLWAYSANGDGELTVADKQEVTILEPDGKPPVVRYEPMIL